METNILNFSQELFTDNVKEQIYNLFIVTY